MKYFVEYVKPSFSWVRIYIPTTLMNLTPFRNKCFYMLNVFCLLLTKCICYFRSVFKIIVYLTWSLSFILFLLCAWKDYFSRRLRIFQLLLNYNAIIVIVPLWMLFSETLFKLNEFIFALLSVLSLCGNIYV